MEQGRSYTSFVFRTSYTITEAKARLSRLIREARSGKEVIITHGRAKKPVAKILLLGTVVKRRKPGSFAGRITADPKAFEPLSTEEAKVWDVEQHPKRRR